MRALRLLCLAASVTLTSVAPAWAQPAEVMSAGLIRQLQDVEVQKQLIVLGVLDATAGRASRDDLRKAVEWFRRAYQSAPGVGPLTDEEKEKLKQAKAKFDATTGLKELTYRDQKTGTDIQLLVPLNFVGATPQKFDEQQPGQRLAGIQGQRRQGGRRTGNSSAVRVHAHCAVQAERHAVVSAIQASTFDVRGVCRPGRRQQDGGFVSSNLVLTFVDKLKGVLMRYAKAPPKSFVAVPDFLVPVVATENSDTGDVQSGSDGQRLAAADAEHRQSAGRASSPSRTVGKPWTPSPAR